MFYNSLSNLQKVNFNKNLPLVVTNDQNQQIELKVGRNYYFQGQTGSSKTTTAISLAKAFIDKYSPIVGEKTAQESVKLVKFHDLISLMKSFEAQDKEKIREILAAKFLIIDDLGVGYGKDYSLIEFENFIDDRLGMANKAVTIFTTNLSFKGEENQELAQRYSRILSRIMHLVSQQGFISFKNQDFRMKAKPDFEFDFSIDDGDNNLKLVTINPLLFNSKEEMQEHIEQEKQNGATVIQIQEVFLPAARKRWNGGKTESETDMNSFQPQKMNQDTWRKVANSKEYIEQIYAAQNALTATQTA